MRSGSMVGNGVQDPAQCGAVDRRVAPCWPLDGGFVKSGHGVGRRESCRAGVQEDEAVGDRDAVESAVVARWMIE